MNTAFELIALDMSDIVNPEFPGGILFEVAMKTYAREERADPVGSSRREEPTHLIESDRVSEGVRKRPISPA
jgi:hypothetical protein